MSDDKNLPTAAPTGGVPTSVPLGNGGTMDLSWMPEHERRALMTDYARGLINISQKANEMGVEVSTLRNTLTTLSDNTKQMAQDGLSVTATHVHNSQFGRTEVIVGNTETAGKGKLSKSQTGERDWTPFYVFGALIAVVLIAMAMGGR